MASPQDKLSRHNSSTLLYHDLFDFPLTTAELFKWQCNLRSQHKYSSFGGYYFLEGRKNLVKERQRREKHAQYKLKIAQRAAGYLQRIPTVMFVGITGSLAMRNSKKGSDIDFLIITKTGSLWTTRLIAYVVLKMFSIKIRKVGEKEEKDRLCLNMWLDEKDIVFRQRNIYTAHEIAQIVPLINKNNTYEKLITKNKWVREYWPNAVKGVSVYKTNETKAGFIIKAIEKWARGVQMLYMKGKISREVISPTRAFFHPFDWGAKVVSELENRVGESKKSV